MDSGLGIGGLSLGKDELAESTRLHGRMRIMKRDGGELPVGEKVSVVNNIFNSLWSSINICLNGTEITDPSSRWYSYKSYF